MTKQHQQSNENSRLLHSAGERLDEGGSLTLPELRMKKWCLFLFFHLGSVERMSAPAPIPET